MYYYFGMLVALLGFLFIIGAFVSLAFGGSWISLIIFLILGAGCLTLARVLARKNR